PSVSATGTYLQCLTCHRHLHSFPTRRSSDLGIVTDAFTDGHKHIPEQTGINIRFGHHTHANRILPFFRMQVGHQLPIQVDIEAAVLGGKVGTTTLTDVSKDNLVIPHHGAVTRLHAHITLDAVVGNHRRTGHYHSKPQVSEH